jgi:hypothetical protein
LTVVRVTNGVTARHGSSLAAKETAATQAGPGALQAMAAGPKVLLHPSSEYFAGADAVEQFRDVAVQPPAEQIVRQRSGLLDHLARLSAGSRRTSR